MTSLCISVCLGFRNILGDLFLPFLHPSSLSSIRSTVVMARTRSSYQPRGRPSMDDISMDEILPGDEISVITPSSSSASPLKATAPCSSSAMADANHNPPQYSSFSTGQKRLIVTMVTLGSFFSPLSGQIYYPIMPTLVQAYDLTPALINLTITSYMFLQGLAPTFMGTFADMCGRRPAYIVSFTIYTIANIGLALQTNYPALMILRCLQSAGSSGAVAFGYGVISDIATPAERGTYVGPMSAGTMLGPALGPVIGGLLARYFGWRSVFWFLVIVSGGFLVCFWALVPETARVVVGDGSGLPREWWRLSGLQLLKRRQRNRTSADGNTSNVESAVVEKDTNEKGTGEINPATSTTKLRFPNPIKTLATLLEPDALILISSIGLLMITNAALLTSTPTLFREIWDLNDLQIGLCFIPLGTGASLGAIVNGYVLNENYRRLYQRHAEVPCSTAPAALNLKNRSPPVQLPTFPIEKARLQLSFPTLCLTITTLFPYGFVLQSRTHLSAPLTLHFLNGFATVACTNTLNTLLVDLFPDRPATAAAACNLVRCWLGALGAGTVDFMLRGMGWRGCFGFLVEYAWGRRWREDREKKRVNTLEDGCEAEKKEGCAGGDCGGGKHSDE
ncbi:putative MFS transporter [Aspergillus stella-maris]|uniref:putative MFS transporter n=1 Tax=Aspergillus stella-maris TaxID=1810926 RepID=UPI003CCE1821